MRRGRLLELLQPALVTRVHSARPTMADHFFGPCPRRFTRSWREKPTGFARRRTSNDDAGTTAPPVASTAAATR